MQDLSSTEGLQQESLELLVRGAEYLRLQIGRDGGWHSRHYGQLKDGAAITALILYTQAKLPAAQRAKFTPELLRGQAFLSAGLAKKQAPAAPDGTLDFPTYAAAHWLLAIHALGGDFRNEKTEELLAKFLVESQLTEGRGFASDHPQYGGWDFLSRADAQGITTGTSISVTSLVIRALLTLPETDERELSIEHGTDYVHRCRTKEGFAFTTEPMSLSNKAGYVDSKQLEARTYGSATCDGVLVLAAAKSDHEWKSDAAIVWLQKQLNLEIVPGFETLPQEVDWQRGLRYYYYASLAPLLVYFTPNNRATFAKGILAELKKEVRRDGSWANASSRMREDDPLIATAFAVQALASLTAHFA